MKRQEFIVARAILRRILARYLNVPPATLTFAYGPSGKPRLHNPSTLPFNLAHAGGWGLLGVTASGEIGVDVEWLMRPVDIGQIAGLTFGAEVRSELEELAPELRSQRFHRLWTAREACLKLLGTGFTHSGEIEGHPFRTGHILVAPDYLGAWASETAPTALAFWDFRLLDSE